MPGETTTITAVDSQFPKWFDSMITQEARPYNVFSRSFAKYRGPHHSATFRFTFLSDPGAAAETAEGTSMTNTSLSTTGADVSVGTIGMAATITKEHEVQSLYSAFPTYGAQLIRSVEEKFQTDAMAVIDNFTNVTGTSGVDAVMTDLIEAGTALAGRDAAGTVVGIFHTRQTGDLRNDVSTTTAAAASSVDIMGVDAANFTGFAGVWHRIPIYETQLVNSADGGANRAGAIFVIDDAIGLYEQWAPQSQTDEDIFLPGRSVAVTQRFGIGVIRDSFGQLFKTDA